MKKYLFTLGILIVMLSCGKAVQEFYYAKDPTETFYVSEQEKNFSIEENVLGNFPISDRDGRSEDFNVGKKPDRNLGHYTGSEEVITVESASKVDIVWSVDNSDSMEPWQKKLADNFSRFAGDFSQKNIDFKMAIVTTGSADNKDTNGKLNSTELKKNKQNFINDFKNKIKVGIDPVWQVHSKGTQERSFGFVKKFLQDNTSWPRSDALLVVVYLSDEPEQSAGTVQSHVSYMTSLKGEDSSKVKVFSICDDRTRKHGIPGGPFNGCERFKQMANSTNGLVRDINGSFADIAQEFGDSIFSSLARPKTLFSININPKEPSKLKVAVDGSEVPRDTTETNGWNYDGNDNTIEFFGSYVPAKGASIKVYEEGDVETIFRLADTFDSSRENALMVEVNGSVVPRDTSELDGWNYDSSCNCVEFFGSHIPTKGAKINITLPGIVDSMICWQGGININHLNKVEVTKGGDIVPQDDSKSNGWAYNTRNGCIEFFGGHALAVGDVIRVTQMKKEFCSIQGFDVSKLDEVRFIVGGRDIPKESEDTVGWSFNSNTGCIELYGDHGLKPGVPVKIMWGDRFRFCLKEELDESKLETVVIAVDGVVIEKGGEGVGWDYDKNANCISFYGNNLPQVNSKIEITYTPD